MNHYKYSSKTNFKSSPSTARVFRQTSTRGVFRNNVKNKKINYYSNNKFNLLNLVFVFAGIFSVISLGLIFAPNIMTAKAAKAQTPKAQPVTIVTNFNSQEYKASNKGKSFLQPVQPLEAPKK